MVDILNLKLNKYQTPITEELKKSLHREIWNELEEYISTVPYIKHLISDETVRGYAKDKPKDQDGKIIVDLTKPHILEDMDFFRERALFFEEHGKYTNLTPNSNPNSDYAQFWKEELRRWKYGLVREYDGEWIPGELYFYWNYSPIWLVEKDPKKGKSKTKKEAGQRIRKFPKPWAGDYLFHHYIHQSKVNGQHGKLLKCRGIGFPGPKSEPVLTPDGWKTYGDIKVGDYLINRKGNPIRVSDVYEQGYRTLYEVYLKDGRTIRCSSGHLWSVYDKNKGSINKDKLYTYHVEDLLKNGLYWNNKNGNKLYKYYIPDLEEPVKYSEKSLPIGPYALGLLLGDGSMSTADIKLAVQDSDKDETLNNLIESLGDGFYIHSSNDNSINYKIRDNIKCDIIRSNVRPFPKGGNRLKEAIKDLNLNVTTSYKFIPSIYKLSSVEQRLELIKGLMDSDGSISTKGSMEFTNSNERLLDDVAEVLRSLGIKCTKRLGRSPRRKVINGVECNIKQEYRLYIQSSINLFKLTRKSERFNPNKRLFKNNPIIDIKPIYDGEDSVCFTVIDDEHLYLSTDFIPTHNSFKCASWSPRNMYIHPGSGNPNFHLASEKGFLTGDKGIFGKVIDCLDWIAETTPLPKLRLMDSKKAMEIQLGYQDEYGVRKGLLSSVYGISLKDNPEKARGIRGPLIHYEEDGLFPNLETAWGVNRKAVEDGDVSFGFMLAGGTGGTEGASFEGSEKLFYNHGAYNIYGIPNVFDKNINGVSTCGYFWGAYMNRNGCYDEIVGESDVVKALIEILEDRFIVKYNSSDPKAITQKKAEECITPQEAVLRTDGTIFPIADLKDHLESIFPKKESFLAEHYVGNLTYGLDGNVKWQPSTDLYPIRSYSKMPANKTGAIEIFEMPKKNGRGEIANGRYIGGIDPIDADAGTSLFSVMIMDTFTDRIVAEYTGRPRTAKQAYEITLKLLMFYNAQANYENNLKGLFSYFDSKNKLYLLADTPQILKDMELVKANNLYGNRSKGSNANTRVNSWARLLQADWLLEKAQSNDEEDKRLNLHRLRSIAYIEELIYWNPDGNFDRVSAAGMLFILREDRLKRSQTAKDNQYKEIKRISDDPFFNKNYTFNKSDSREYGKFNYE